MGKLLVTVVCSIVQMACFYVMWRLFKAESERADNERMNGFCKGMCIAHDYMCDPAGFDTSNLSSLEIKVLNDVFRDYAEKEEAQA